MRSFVISRTVIPNRIVDNENGVYRIWRITKLPLWYHIRNYEIVLNNNHELIKIKFKARHPNKDPVTNEYCLPKTLQNIQCSDIKILPFIEQAMRIYQLNNCYFVPWNDIKWEEF